METDTTVAQGLHTTDDSAGYDAACKRVLSERLFRIKKCKRTGKRCERDRKGMKILQFLTAGTEI